MIDLSSLDPDSKPFSNRPWSHTSAGACSLELIAKTLRLPTKGRADRFVTHLRRDEGSALHEAAELQMKALKAKGKFAPSERVVRHVLSAYPHLRSEEARLASKLAMWEERFVFDIDRELACELKLAITADGRTSSYDAPEVGAWRVRIDWAERRADGRLRLIDYKNKPSIDSDGDLKRHEQLAGYAWALGALYPVLRTQSVFFGVYYFEYGVTKEVELQWSEIDRLHARQMARADAKANLRVIDIQAEPGFGRCQYCDYLTDCPAGEALLSEEQTAPASPEQARELAKRVFVATELVKSGREALKRYAQEFGPVAIDADTGYGFKVTESNTANLLKIIEALNHAGIPLAEVMRLDLETAKRAAKDNEVLGLILKEFVTRQPTGTEFGPYRPDKVKAISVSEVRERVKKPKVEKPTKTGKKKAGGVTSLQKLG